MAARPSSWESRMTLRKAYFLCLVLLSLSHDIRCANLGTEIVHRRTVNDAENTNSEKLVRRLTPVKASMPTPKAPALPPIESNGAVTKKVVNESTTPKPYLPSAGSKPITHTNTSIPGPTTIKPTTTVHPVTVRPVSDVHVVTTSAPKHTNVVPHGVSSHPKDVTTTTARPVVSNTTEEPIGSYWDGWNRLLTVQFWKDRYNDHEYMLQLTLPIAIGIGAGALLAFLVFLVRCMHSLRRARRRVRRNKTIHFDKEGSDKWMLLERASSSDEEDTV